MGSLPNDYRVMHGLVEVAGQNHFAVKGLKELGIDAQTILSRPSKFGYPYDRVLFEKPSSLLMPLDLVSEYVGRAALLHEVINDFDLFHFHFGQSFCFGWDLGRLDKAGKSYLFEYHGSDLRYIDWSGGYEGFKGLKASFNRKMTISACTKASKLILHDDELMPHLPDGHAPVHVVPLRADLSALIPSEAVDRGKTTIVHAPSNRSKKGTPYVLEAFDRICRGHKDVECVLIENMTREEALKTYREADIIVDQLVIGTYGMLAIEGMALGKPVVTYISGEMRDNLPRELPIVSGSIIDICEVLEQLVADSERRAELGARGRQYVQDYHDYRVIAQYLKDVYEDVVPPLTGRDAFDYVKGLKA